MRIKPVYVIGAGGHGKVVIDALVSNGVAIEQIRLLDSDPKIAGKQVLGISVETLEIQRRCDDWDFHVAVGNNAMRARLSSQLTVAGGKALSVIHPEASVSRYASVGAGVFVAAKAIVGPEASIADGVIVNHGAIVDHDCVIEGFCHVAPNATLGGAVVAGERVLIGSGASLLPSVRIGVDATVGAGAVVLADVPANQTWAGVPAQEI
jgi:sugar O-acyltransferase (sialic acid O-acetyltransferase NeuD family)